jgi:hypothetical protein
MWKKNCPHCNWLKSDRETFIARKNRGGAVYDSHKIVCRSFNVISDTHDSDLYPKTLYSAISFAEDLMRGKFYNEDGAERYVMPVNKLYLSAFNNIKRAREHPHIMITISRSYGEFNLKRIFMDPDLQDIKESHTLQGEEKDKFEKHGKKVRNKGLNFCKTRGLIPYKNETQIILNKDDILFLANSEYEEYVEFLRKRFSEKGLVFNIDNMPYFLVITMERVEDGSIDMSGIVSSG